MRRIALLTCLATLVPAGTAFASFAQDSASPLASGAAPYNVAAADFDGNGRMDLVAANGTAGSASVFLRGSGGGFTQETGSPYTGGISGATDVAAAKLDADDRTDFVVASYAEDTGGRVYLRDSDNVGFVAQSPMAIPHPVSVDVADLNGDGNLDLVFGSGTQANVYFVLRNSLDNGFEAPVALNASGLIHSVAIGEFSGDGKLDIIATTDAGKLDLWTRNSAGPVGFTAATPVTLDGSANGLVVADFNGDGQQDAAAAVYGIDKAEVLLGHGNKTFTKEGSYPAGDGPVGLASGDFDGNGRPDLVAANQAGKTVTVILRSGTGFVPDSSSPIVTDLAATGLVVADFNADGRVDIAASNIDKSFISILLNTTTPPPPPPPPPPPDLDKDDDGIPTPADCDDANPAVHPGAVDIPGNAVNEDCAGGPAPFPVVDTTIGYTAGYARSFTIFQTLYVRNALAGQKLVVRCRGRGCPFRSKSRTVKEGARKISLMKGLKHKRLRVGAKLQVRVLQAGYIGRVDVFTVREGKPPKRRKLCLPPGANAPARCPSP